jgi:prepilin-type processing-associated H-X9-DG protein
VQVLPFIEQGNVYRQFDFREGVYAASNATVMATHIKGFYCPSDPRAGPMAYMGCHHDVEAPIDVDNRGVLYLNSHVRYDDITDGPAYTLLLGEARQSPSLGWASGTRATLRNTGHPINTRDLLGPPMKPAAFWSPRPGEVVSAVQSGLLPICYVGGFSSWHPGGANVLLCDGSARFLKQTMDQHVLRRLANRSDGELIGDDQF